MAAMCDTQNARRKENKRNIDISSPRISAVFKTGPSMKPASPGTPHDDGRATSFHRRGPAYVFELIDQTAHRLFEPDHAVDCNTSIKDLHAATMEDLRKHFFGIKHPLDCAEEWALTKEVTEQKRMRKAREVALSRMSTEQRELEKAKLRFLHNAVNFPMSQDCDTATARMLVSEFEILMRQFGVRIVNKAELESLFEAVKADKPERNYITLGQFLAWNFESKRVDGVDALSPIKPCATPGTDYDRYDVNFESKQVDGVDALSPIKPCAAPGTDYDRYDVNFESKRVDDVDALSPIKPCAAPGTDYDRYDVKAYLDRAKADDDSDSHRSGEYSDFELGGGSEDEEAYMNPEDMSTDVSSLARADSAQDLIDSLLDFPYDDLATHVEAISPRHSASPQD